MDGDLEDMLNNSVNKSKMTSKMIRKIFKQLNSGFKMMIKKKKVRRDLKPSNILFTYTNDEKSDFIVKLATLAWLQIFIKLTLNQMLELYFLKHQKLKMEFIIINVICIALV